MCTIKINSYNELKDIWENSDSKSEFLSSYIQKENNFIPYLLPEDALQFSVKEIIDILTNRFGNIVSDIINGKKDVESPVANLKSTKWITCSNMVGINVRTIGNLFNIVKYVLTIPAGEGLHNSIHLLPLWETGVVGSIYAISSWNLNTNYFSKELFENFPRLDTIESQLLLIINFLHLMGFAVGMDVIPHTDRFSEIVLSNPSYFEWLQRKDTTIVDHTDSLIEKVEEVIFSFILEKGSAIDTIQVPETSKDFFEIPEAIRNQILFGEPKDLDGRIQRRVELIKILFKEGFEAVPATMAPPYRGLKVKENKEPIIDSNGLDWRDYEIIKPEPMSRVFGPLTRYKFYENKDNNKDWEIDFEKPRKNVFTYLQEKYFSFQKRFNLDFMRGDMSHVQMRSSGVPFVITEFYDPMKAVKNYIKKGKPYFGYFAESFLAPPNVMAYGNEVDHLEATDAEVVLGDLQSLEINNPEFFRKFRQYLDIKATRKVKPSFTVITSDKDDPRFDKFYLKGNEFRYFVTLFMVDIPTYYSLGFETRDPHPEPFPNEFYTKLFVFQERVGSKKTSGSYQWGKNWQLFVNLIKIRLIAEQIIPEILNKKVKFLQPPDPMYETRTIIWTTDEHDVKYIFIANSDVEHVQTNISIPVLKLDKAYDLELLFSLPDRENSENQVIIANNYRFKLDTIEPGAVRIYKILRK